jgi:carboxymethylenebutenolidase
MMEKTMMKIPKKMMTKLSFVSIVCLLASSCLAADSKSVSYKSGDETVQALLYTPAGKGPFPAIIVIHEYWGLNDWVKD